MQSMPDIGKGIPRLETSSGTVSGLNLSIPTVQSVRIHSKIGVFHPKRGVEIQTLCELCVITVLGNRCTPLRYVVFQRLFPVMQAVIDQRLAFVGGACRMYGDPFTDQNRNPRGAGNVAPFVRPRGWLLVGLRHTDVNHIGLVAYHERKHHVPTTSCIVESGSVCVLHPKTDGPGLLHSYGLVVSLATSRLTHLHGVVAYVRKHELHSFVLPHDSDVTCRCFDIRNGRIGSFSPFETVHGPIPC